MKTVTILDTETTGLSPTEDKCIEVAVVHYSLEHASVIKSFAGLIAIEGENEAERVNHIPTGLLHDSGSQAECAWQAAATVAQGSEAVLAHNSDFDHAWVPEGSALLDLPWIDTLALDWPMQSKPGSALITLALEHGLGVVDPHRALSDCMLLARMLTRCHELGHDLNALLAPGCDRARYSKRWCPTMTGSLRRWRGSSGRATVSDGCGRCQRKTRRNFRSERESLRVDIGVRSGYIRSRTI